ncbi:MAG: cyclic nucleotide-binding/CBS domain-containing protein, partial [Aquificae bacterium]|nr:cyclic nucleotide-binding/CBS domain-containing protein [Aquificota bacterium]
KEIFLKLTEKYPEFADYFSESLAKRISSARSRSQQPTLEKLLTLQVKNLKVRKVPRVLPGESVLNAVKKMSAEGASCALVEGNPAGIITERDVLRKVVAEEKDPKLVKVEQIMSSPVVSVSKEDFLFDVLLLMAKHNIRRVGVKEGERIIGVIEDRDIIALESQSLLVLIKEIQKAKDTQELSYLYSLVSELVKNLFSEGVKPYIISRLISELSDKFVKRAVELAIKELGLEPLVSFSVLALGSEGRREQTLKTDQDNALIYDDTYPVLDVDLKDYFRKFGKKVSEILLKVGFPPCPSGVMVENPEWNKGKSEWFKTLEEWFRKPEPKNTLKAGIFLDFRNAFGDASLEGELREFVFELAQRHELFIAYMLRDAVRFRPPLGLFGRLKTEDEGVDVKKGGIFPITHGVRSLAVRFRVPQTGTLERIEALTRKGILDKEMGENLREAFNYLQHVRLKSQIEKLSRGEEPDNYVKPENLTKLERDLLKDAFRVVEEFQSFIERRFLAYLPR